METIQTKTQAETLADILAGSFETRERQGGGTFHARKDSAPEWVGDAGAGSDQDLADAKADMVDDSDDEDGADSITMALGRGGGS